MSDTAPTEASQRDLLGVHFAVHIFVATAILWFLLKHLGDLSPIWAISSMIAVSDPQVNLAFQTFRGRIFNSALGCVIGLIVLSIGGSNELKLPFALAITVLISVYVIRIPVMWRQAPITAAIVIAGGLHGDKHQGVHDGLVRVGEVMLGCVIGLVVTYVLSKVWPPPATGYAPGGKRK